MFKSGDKVICINLGVHIRTNIKVGEIYTTKKLINNELLELFEFYECYCTSSFITLKESRKLKLEKLNGKP